MAERVQAATNGFEDADGARDRAGRGEGLPGQRGQLLDGLDRLEGGGRLVVSVNDAEAKELHDALAGVVAAAK